jgi:hypothetical protein
MNVAEYITRAPVIWPEILEVFELVNGKVFSRRDLTPGMAGCIYNSGDFCVSITAAIGIPKFETGPQKSIYPGSISTCPTLFAFIVGSSVLDSKFPDPEVHG